MSKKKSRASHSHEEEHELTPGELPPLEESPAKTDGNDVNDGENSSEDPKIEVMTSAGLVVMHKSEADARGHEKFDHKKTED